MVTKYSDKDKKFNKAKELSNTFSLRKYKTSNYPEVTNVVDHLFNEMVNVYRLSLTRPSSIKNLNHHIEFFVLNLYKAYCIDPTKVIPYSRDRSAYSGKKPRYKNKFGLSFRYSVEGIKTGGKPVVTFLEKQGYIVNFNFQHDKANPNNSYQNRRLESMGLSQLSASGYTFTNCS
jgi:hypothetical protein